MCDTKTDFLKYFSIRQNSILFSAGGTKELYDSPCKPLVQEPIIMIFMPGRGLYTCALPHPRNTYAVATLTGRAVFWQPLGNLTLARFELKPRASPKSETKQPPGPPRGHDESMTSGVCVPYSLTL